MAKQKREVIEYVLQLLNERTENGVRVHKNAVIIAKVKEKFDVEISRGAIYYWNDLYGQEYLEKQTEQREESND